jgi:AraC-like DNA-binding protein
MKWFEYILFSGVGQGIFLAVVLPRLSGSNKEANRILSVVLFLVSLILLSRIGLPKIPVNIAVRFWGYPDALALLFGPLYYMYFKRLLFSGNGEKRFFLHFIPSILQVIWVTSRNLMLTSPELIELFQSGRLHTIWVVTIFAHTCSYLTYWILSFLLILRFKRGEDHVNSIKVPFGFVMIILSGILAGIFIWFFWSINFLFGIKIFVFTNTNAGWIIIPFLTYFIGYYAIIQPEIFRLSPGTRKGMPRISPEISDKIRNELNRMMQQEKPYLDPGIRLAQLAAVLQTSSNNLSWIINSTSHCNFYDYINKYRVTAFIDKIKQGQHKHHTLLALAYDSGFNSKSTFNKVFRKFMHDNPGNYVKWMNKTNEQKGTIVYTETYQKTE